MTKILIVDDKPDRYSALVGRLCPAKLPSDAIRLCGNVRDALVALRDEYIDVLVVDMMLPEMPWSSPSIDGGARLLEHLTEDNTLKPPKYIIGITAAKEDDACVERVFSAQPWLLIRYTSAGDAWEEKLAALITHALSNEQRQDQLNYKTDVCLITALRSPEYEALIASGIAWGESVFIDTTTYVRHGKLVSNGRELTIVIGCSLRMGATESALLAYKLIEEFRPRIIAMGGICAGYEPKVQYGDVIVGSPVWDYTSAKITRDEDGVVTTTYSPDDIPIEVELQSRFEALNEDTELLAKIHADWKGDKPRAPLSVKVAPSATGPAVIADGSVFEDIRRHQNRGTLGLEMEAYGVYCAARMVSRPRPIAFSAKAVCDYGSFLKDDKFQKYAAYTSAQIIYQFLRRFGSELSEIVT